MPREVVPLGVPILLTCVLLSSSLKDDLEEESATEGYHPGRFWVSVPPKFEPAHWPGFKFHPLGAHALCADICCFHL